MLYFFHDSLLMNFISGLLYNTLKAVEKYFVEVKFSVFPTASLCTSVFISLSLIGCHVLFQGLFSDKILRDLLMFLPKLAMEFGK